MKKITGLFIVICFAISMNAYAQSENAALVINKADGEIATATLFAFGSEWDGFLTYVETNSGNKIFSFTATLADGPGVEETSKLSVPSSVPPFFNEVLELNCVVTKSGNANCRAKN